MYISYYSTLHSFEEKQEINQKPKTLYIYVYVFCVLIAVVVCTHACAVALCII